MREQIIIAQQPRSSLADISKADFVRVRMHDAAGAATVGYEGRLNGAAVSGSLTRAGTTEVFANANLGWYQPGVGSGSADNYVLLNATGMEDFFRLDTLRGSGTLIILGVVEVSSAVANDRVFAMGRAITASVGGCELLFSASANDFGLNFRAVGDSTGAQPKRAITDDVPTPFMAVIDGIGLTGTMAINGNWANGDSADFTLGGLPWYGVDANFGPPVIGAQIATGPSYTPINDGASQDMAFHGLTFIRTAGQLSQTFLSLLCREHALYPRELLAAFGSL